MAERSISAQLHKPFFGRPYLKLDQCVGLWSYLFELGGLLGAKHGAKLDAFVSAFLGLTGEAGEAERVLLARANYLLGRHSLNSMKSWDLIGADLADRIGYKGDVQSGLFMEPGMQKIAADVAARDGWNYARDGAALGAFFPEVVRAMFERTYAAVSKQEWQEACASGLDLGPEPFAERSYEETTEQDNKKFIDYCREFRADLYLLLSLESGERQPQSHPIIPDATPTSFTSAEIRTAFQQLCVDAARTELESSWCADVISFYETADDQKIVTMTFAAYISWLMFVAFTRVLPSDLANDAVSSVLSDFSTQPWCQEPVFSQIIEQVKERMPKVYKEPKYAKTSIVDLVECGANACGYTLMHQTNFRLMLKFEDCSMAFYNRMKELASSHKGAI